MEAAAAKNPTVERANFALVMAFAGLWLTPIFQFWGAVHGAFRPKGYPTGDLAPSLAWFLIGLAVCFVPCVLPPAFYAPRGGRKAVRLLERLGVRAFKRVTTNGDLVNRWGRRREPDYRVVRDAESAAEWAEKAREAERNHWVFLSMGALSAVYAARLGWYGWTAGLVFSNVVFNVYPILLQRYNRLRVRRLLSGGPEAAPFEAG